MAPTLTEYLEGKRPRGFAPHTYYSADGDYLTYFFKGDDHYAERVDERLTVYRSMADREFVGFKLKGVEQLLDTLGDFQLIAGSNGDGDVKLGMLLLAGLSEAEEDDAKPVYSEAARQTGSVRVPKRQLQPA